MACALTTPIFAAPLIQIRQGYATTWGDLRLAVEIDPADGWKALVRDRIDGRTLYSAQRQSLAAAKVAATEFALFRDGVRDGLQTPETVAQHLRWIEYW